MKTTTCTTCGKEIDLYEYRGFIFCETHFEEGIKLVDFRRQEVMDATNTSVASQRNGEFKNNSGKYHLGNVAEDGLPIVPVKEPQALKDYESGKL